MRIFLGFYSRSFFCAISRFSPVICRQSQQNLTAFDMYGKSYAQIYRHCNHGEEVKQCAKRVQRKKTSV